MRARTCLAFVCVAAFALRAFPRWDATFPEGSVRLADPDGWHHLRQVELWVAHFPRRVPFDPYALFPDGQTTGVAPLTDLIAATLAWAIGLGAPSQETVWTVVALLPCVFGALTCIPAFLLGRRAGGTAGGFVAAFVVAASPGQLFARSMLGFADHHALETFLATTAAAALCAAFADAPPRSPRAARLAALALVLSALNWNGAPLHFAGLATATACVVLSDVAARRDATQPCVAFGYAAALAAAGLAIVSPALDGARLAIGVLAAGTVGVLATTIAAGGLASKGVRPWLAAAAAVTCLVVATGAAAVALPGAASQVADAASWFDPTAMRVTVGEARPLWLGDDGPSVRPTWLEFGAAGIAALAGIFVVARRAAASRTDAALLAMLLPAIALAFVQSRFAANAAVAVAVLAGAAIGPRLGRAWDGGAAVPRWLGRGLWPAVAAIALVAPTGPALVAVSRSRPTPDDAWMEALLALRDRSPEPFGDRTTFGAAFDAGSAPAPSYGVLAWWDAGYWITRVARRAPFANPTQAGALFAANVLLEGDPERAAETASTVGARYVVVDASLPMLPRGAGFAGKLPSLAPWALRSEAEFLRVVRERQADGSTADVVVFLPAYFRATCVRLHTFGGRAVRAGAVTGVETRPGDDGRPEVVASQRFATWDEAAAWAAESPATRIAGSLSPLAPCVPLEEARRFRPFVRSELAEPLLVTEPMWSVQVFEVIPR